MTRKLRALRNLAERPGTEAEGKLAREILARLEARELPRTGWEYFKEYLRSGSRDDLEAAINAPGVCDCGARVPHSETCSNLYEHKRIGVQKVTRFPRGTRVYYNYWAYSPNCAGIVMGPSNTWNWIRVKFDHLKHPRSVPIYSAKGWHLSTEPIDYETLRAMDIRGGMEKFEWR